MSYINDMDLVFSLKSAAASMSQNEETSAASMAILSSSYEDLILSLHNSPLLEDSARRDLRPITDFFTALGGISILFAVAQLEIVGMITANATALSTEHFNALISIASIAVSLDALGALSALLYVHTLLSLINEGHGIIRAKCRISNYIENALREALTDDSTLPGSNDTHLTKLINSCITINENMLRVGNVVMQHSDANWGIQMVIFLGAALFFVSFLAFSVMTQHLEIWLSTVVVGGVMVCGLTLQELCHHSGIRRRLPPFMSRLVT